MPQPPAQPKIYHIVHVDRLASVINAGCLWSDSAMAEHAQPGTTIGMGGIKQRRLSLPVARAQQRPGQRLPPGGARHVREQRGVEVGAQRHAAQL